MEKGYGMVAQSAINSTVNESNYFKLLPIVKSMVTGT
jgi:hypothetical protein